ncbi:MAG: sugar ABC transporter substrate-binding protein, partial [Eubacterium sp.]|nr:sugar ABC transporter substrate-binding protein [Eubacterium sp.]
DQASYQVRLQKLMTEQAEVKNIRILWNYADWDPELQNSQIENMIERRVDALIISPVNSKSILESLKDASSVGIPVINLNMKVDAYSSVYIDTYVGASSSEEGVLAAELADILLPDGGKAAIIEGSAGTDPQIYRTQAFIDELRDKPEIQIEEILSANWDRKQAKTCAEELLQKYADLSLIYCQDNNMAAGAIEAVKRSGRSGKVYVIGIGEADEETVGLLKEGSLSGFIVQDPEFEAVSAINSADQLAKGRKIRPWIKNPVSILTADTIGDYQKPIPYL